MESETHFDFGVIGSDTGSDQTERNGPLLEDDDVRIRPFEQVLRHIEAGRTGADDGNVQALPQTAQWAQRAADEERGPVREESHVLPDRSSTRGIS